MYDTRRIYLPVTDYTLNAGIFTLKCTTSQSVNYYFAYDVQTTDAVDATIVTYAGDANSLPYQPQRLHGQARLQLAPAAIIYGGVITDYLPFVPASAFKIALAAFVTEATLITLIAGGHVWLRVYVPFVVQQDVI
jgi:hypothetical protein